MAGETESCLLGPEPALPRRARRLLIRGPQTGSQDPRAGPSCGRRAAHAAWEGSRAELPQRRALGSKNLDLEKRCPVLSGSGHRKEIFSLSMMPALDMERFLTCEVLYVNEFREADLFVHLLSQDWGLRLELLGISPQFLLLTLGCRWQSEESRTSILGSHPG